MNDEIKLDSTQPNRTELRLRCFGGYLRLSLSSRRSLRERSAQMLTIAQRLIDLEGIDLIESSPMFQSDLERMIGFMDRKMSMSHALRTDTPEQKLGFEIRSRRLELGWSQFELARRAGVDRTYLGRLERGRPGMRDSTLAKIEKALFEGGKQVG